MAKRRWLGMEIRVSTCAFNSRIPSSAQRMRFLPSKRNGLVTTPTVSAPTSLAMRATTGAPPVPVPPPIPAVTNTMSAPTRWWRSSSSPSSVERRPTSGLAPAPRPLAPSCTLVGARLTRMAWASVLAAIKLTPDKPALIIVLRALPPPPPIPTMRICAPFPPFSTNSIITYLLPLRFLPPGKLLALKKIHESTRQHVLVPAATLGRSDSERSRSCAYAASPPESVLHRWRTSDCSPHRLVHQHGVVHHAGLAGGISARRVPSSPA